MGRPTNRTCVRTECAKPFVGSGKYCSRNCARAAERASRRTLELHCECGKVEVVEVYRTAPEACSECRKEKARGYHRAWAERVQRGDDVGNLSTEWVGELEESRLRLSCELNEFRRKVMALARDLGVAA
jgi:hypothetical protein